MYTTSKMGQWCTKAPSKVKEWGWQALRYAAATLDLGLEFTRDVGPRFGHEDQLAFPKKLGYLEIYTDASHAPQGDKSTQCILTIWRGSLLLWETARQPFTALSSAEAELIAMVRGVQVSDCVSPIIEELIQADVLTSVLGDNSAALASFNSNNGSWHSRHLRMRAAAARERIVRVGFVPGSLQVADVGTKPLPSSKMLSLLAIMNVKMPSEGNGNNLAVANIFGRLCGLRTDAKGISPATALLVVLLSKVPVVKAQPSFVEDDFEGWIRLLVAVCVVLAGTVIWALPSTPMASESAGLAPRPNEVRHAEAGQPSQEGYVSPRNRRELPLVQVTRGSRVVQVSRKGVAFFPW